MARQYAKVYLSIWATDSDFRKLDGASQRLYFLLTSSPKLSPAGCAVAQPRKWAQQASDTTADDIEAALSVLETKRYVLIDHETEEVLIRSFIRHDRGFRNQFLRKSIESAIALIESTRLRDHAALELAACIESAANGQVEDSDEESDEDSLEDSYPDPDEDATEDTSEANYTQQPSTSPSTSSQQAQPGHAPGLAAKVLKPAAAALKLLLDHKVKTECNGSETGYRTSVGPKLMEEHREALAAYLDRRPNADADELAVYVLRVPGKTSAQSEPKRPWYANPACETCEGEGIYIVPDRGAGTATPCPCRRPDEYPPAPPDPEPPRPRPALSLVALHPLEETA